MQAHPATPVSPPTRNTLALLAVCLAALMFGLEISSVPVILPTLEATLNSDFSGLQWVMNAYTIACTAVLMATGTLADRYGRKRIFLISILLFALTSWLCGLAWNTPVLIVARFLQGAAGGAMLICLVAVLSHQFPAGLARSRAFSIWGIIFGIGLGFGPLIGGVIIALASWRWVFWVHVALSALTFFLAARGVRDSRDTQAGKLDLAGVVTLSIAVLGLAWFVTEGAASGFGSRSALFAISASGVSLLLFVVAERRNPRPMFDFSVLRIRNFSGALLGSAGMNCSFWPFIIYLPIYFQTGLGKSAASAGISLLAYTLPTLLFPPLGERLALRYRPGLVIPAGLATIGLGFFLMYLGNGVAPWLGIIPGCLLAGAGLGITNTPVTNTTTASVPGERAGMASGMDMSARMISLAINIALMGYLLVQGVLHYLRQAQSSGAMSSPALAGQIASGALPPMSEEIGRQALLHGFSVLMLYGALAAWLLAALSYLVFADRTKARFTNRRASMD